MEVNVQCQQILEGIERLEKYLQERIAKEALDLASNHETTRNQELLLRLKKSLLQYTDRGKNLVYVGFMGHFSAGKSSTINSLLKLEETSEEARRVGLNPVDKAITLITHSENRDSIFNTTKEGLVSIRSNFIDSEFLKDIVIADTPGTGDPILASEIAKDFLPICDLIVYFFSAAIPLDSADVPLLKEKYAQLAFIPIQFVVTRADEFKRNRESSFGVDNFDKTQARVFLNELSQRINHLFKNDPYVDSDNIVLIDNKSHFNTDQLRQTVLEFANISDVQAQINIHSHKVLYFKSSAEVLKFFFCKFLLDKLEILSSIIRNSQANIDRFQGKIRLTNHVMTESWNEKLTSINAAASKVRNQLLLVQEIPSSLGLLYSKNKKSSYLEVLISKEANEQASSVKRELERNIIPQLRNEILSNRHRVNKISSLSSSIKVESFELNLSAFQKDKLLVNTNFLPSAILSGEALKVFSESDNNLAQYKRDLESDLKNLKDLLSEHQPVRECQSFLDSAISDLDKDFDDYFESITVYRSGVFSLNVKEAISKLGLGQRMDELEADELTDEQKIVIKQDAQKHIFPNISQSFIDTSKSSVSLQLRVDELQRKVKSMSWEKTNLPNSLLESWKNSELDIIKDEIAGEVESDIRQLQQSVNVKAQEILTKFTFEWEAEVDKMKAERKKRFTFLSLLFGLIGLAIYLLFLFGSRRDLASNVFVASMFGIAVNLISSVLGGAFAKITDKFPISIRAKESDLLERFREDYSQTLDESINNFQDLIDFDSQILRSFWGKLLTNEPLTIWSTKRKAFYDNLRTYVQEYVELHQEYLQVISEVEESASSYFSDPKSNLQKLIEFSDNLQQTAIKPSFQLLAETKENLETVIRNIQEIDFA